MLMATYVLNKVGKDLEAAALEQELYWFYFA